MKAIYIFLSISFIVACGKTTPCVDFDKVNNTAICNAGYDPVCGCDNITYQNQCIAERNGLVSWFGGPCP
jgi:hypothetical protein